MESSGILENISFELNEAIQNSPGHDGTSEINNFYPLKNIIAVTHLCVVTQ